MHACVHPVSVRERNRWTDITERQKIKVDGGKEGCKNAASKFQSNILALVLMVDLRIRWLIVQWLHTHTR